MVIDKIIGQINADVKSESGAVVLAQTPDALRRCMVAGMELVWMTAECETSTEGNNARMTQETRRHRENVKHPLRETTRG